MNLKRLFYRLIAETPTQELNWNLEDFEKLLILIPLLCTLYTRLKKNVTIYTYFYCF